MHYLTPLDTIEQKLAAQQQRHKDKAERTAKGLINSAVNKQKQEAKRARKQKGAGQGKGPGSSDDEAEDVEHDDDGSESETDEDARAEKEAKRILDKAEADQIKLDQVIQTHLEKFKPPDYLPLTKLSTTEEKQVRSARGVLIQQALEEAQATLAGEKAKREALLARKTQKDRIGSGPVKLGISAAVAALGLSKRRGSVKEKEDKETITKEIMKMGKHLLK